MRRLFAEIERNPIGQNESPPIGGRAAGRPGTLAEYEWHMSENPAY
jgi:hypothetical protein